MFENRYARNYNSLSSEDMRILHGKKICIIGAGGLGGYIAETLARIGVLNLTIADGDVFEESNLNRQLFCTEKKIGLPKAYAAAERIKEVNSDVIVNPVYERIDENNAEKIISGNDLVIDALDNIKTRRIIVQICRKLSIPVVHGAVRGFYGQIAVFMPDSNLFEKIYGNLEDDYIDSSQGNLPFTVQAVSAFETSEAIKLLLNRGNILDKSIMRIDLLNNEIFIIEI